MSLQDVYEGRLAWAEYLLQQPQLEVTGSAPAFKLALSEPS